MALPDLPAASELLVNPGYPVLQAPVWRGNLLPRASTRSFASIMANQAFADPATLNILANAWSSLLDLIQPDLVVAEYAPVLCLAAHDRVPLVAVGSAFVLPPSVGEYFPILQEDAPQNFSEDTMLEYVNRWLTDRGRAPLANLPAIHAAADSFPLSLPELDPYRSQRRDRAAMPMLQNLLAPAPAQPLSEQLSLFAYLSAKQQSTMQLLVALATAGEKVEVYLREKPPNIIAGLRSAGVLVHEHPVPIEAALTRCHAVMHYASLAISTQALSLGRPQICIPTDLEKQLTAKELEYLGVGLLVRPVDLPRPGPRGRDSLSKLVPRVQEFCRATAVRSRVEAVASELAGRSYSDPIPLLIEHLEAML